MTNKELMALPLKERRKIMEKQATEMVDYYKTTDLWKNSEGEDEMEHESVQGEIRKSNILRERFKREVCESLKQISGCVGLPCSTHDYESVKTAAVIDELCNRLVNIADDQLARAINCFDF